MEGEGGGGSKLPKIQETSSHQTLLNGLQSYNRKTQNDAIPVKTRVI